MSDGREARHKPIDEVVVSVVLPVYNEAKVLKELFCAVDNALNACGCQSEIVFVNDGSWDNSAQILDELAATHPHVRVLHFSRNFGHQAAVQAGLIHASGDTVIVMDSDLQDDPRAAAKFLERWREGYDVVYAIRYGRKENAVKRFLFHVFYRSLNRVSRIPMPNDAGNFGLVDRRVAREIARLVDRDRYYAGLRSWVGFKQIGVQVGRGERYDGQPRVSLMGLWRLAKSAIFSFSSFPLTIFYGISLLSLAVFVGLGGFCLYHRLFTGRAIPGWTSMIMTSSFTGAMNSLGIAILGEYIIRIYDQVRTRPLYLIHRKVNFADDLPGARVADEDAVVQASGRAAA